MRVAHLLRLTLLAGAAWAGNAGAQTNTAAAAALAKGYSLEARSAYEGKLRSGDTVPVVVRIENVGPDSAGAIVVQIPDEPGSVRYPVALPRGAKKAISVPFTPTFGAQMHLETDRGTFEIVVSLSTEMARSSLLAIGDGSGGLAFMEALEITKPKDVGASPPRPAGSPYPANESRMPVAVAYSRPEAVPESEAGLDRLCTIALMAGSERLNARQIGALRRYVLRGGHLVFVGGASAPILTDPRIRDLVPYSALRPGEVSVGRQPVSVQRPVPIPGCRNATTEGVPIVRRDYGMGRVTLLSADPVEGGLSKSPYRKEVATRAFDLQRAAQVVGAGLTNGPAVVPAMGQPVAGPGEIDPFSLPIPPTSSILLVLGAYFIIVLPVNFLVLRACKRLELAWFTAPLLAVGFAGLLFRNAGALYSTGLSYASQTTILAASGGGEGLAMGSAQIFFPEATRGPIPVPNVEALAAQLFVQVNDDGYSSRGSSVRGLDVIVTDAPAILDYSSTALEFRDVEYRQSIDLGRGIRVIAARRWKPGQERKVIVENASPYPLTNVRVAYGPANDPQAVGTDETIAAGGRAVLSELKPSPVAASAGISNRDVPMLVASIDAPVGPQMGKQIRSRTSTRILVSGEIR